MAGIDGNRFSQVVVALLPMASPNARAWGRKLLLFFGTLALLVVVIDFVLMRTRYNDQRLLLADVQHRPFLGYVPVEGDPEFNADLLRDARESEDFREADCNVLFLGDSFVYGPRVFPFEALPQQLERWATRKRPGERLRVANFGWISSSPYLSRQLLEKIGRDYQPDLVLLAVDVTDPHEDIKYRHYAEREGVHTLLEIAPSFLLAAKEIAISRGLHEAWFGYPADRLFPVNATLEASRPYMAPMRESIDALAEVAREELGARFALLVLPRHYHYSRNESPKDWEAGAYDRDGENRFTFFAYFDEMRREVDYPVRSLLPLLRDAPMFPTTFYDDPHWVPATHRYLALGTLRILEAEGLLCGSKTTTGSEGGPES